MENAPDLSPDDLRAAWPILSPAERMEAFRQLDDEAAAELFEVLYAPDQAEVLLSLKHARRGPLLARLAPDDLTDVFQALEENARRDVFRSLAPDDLKEVQDLAAYGEDEAGGIMTPDFAHVRPDMTVDEAIVSLRLQLREQPETLRYVYVVERALKLVGVISFRQLFGARPGQHVRDLMETDLVVVNEDTDQEDVAALMTLHHFTALPVVDSVGRIKGIITSDDVIDVMAEEATEDMHLMGAVSPTEIDYVRATVGLLWRRRVGWLMILLITGFVTARVMEIYEGTIEQLAVLVFFVPLIIGAGGNTGTQSAVLIVRSLATGDVRPRDWTRIVVKEALVGLLLGTFLAVALGVWGFLSHGTNVALILSITMIAVVIWANLVGAILPVVLQSVKLDPAVVSTPLVSTLVDITGLVIYFSIAEWLI